jgi:glutamate synthase domain-containing protein 2
MGTTRRVPRWERGGLDRIPAFVEHWGRRPFLIVGALLVALSGLALSGSPYSWPLALLTVAYWMLGLRDMTQRRHSVLRNFPLLGRARYFAESIRPELRQYFVESDHEETPYSRSMRTVIYQRAKGVLDTSPFGTRQDVYASGHEWVAQSLAPTTPRKESARVLVGTEGTARPYSASLFNVSAMSYGSLSQNAILALSEGARQGGFYHNTGEGGVSPYHLQGGADLVWQIGTGYFGCRSQTGAFDPEQFRVQVSEEAIKMVELKLSQGAKPAHGGILPGKKVTAEIARIRGVPVGQTVASPPYHTAFLSPRGLLEFVTQLRELAEGKPVGFKLCVGQPEQFVAIVKVMHETGLAPDFITVDGTEGGTGAAPIEFADSVGMPLVEGLRHVHNTLVGAGVRDRVRLISAGKIATGFDLVRQLALGADLCNAARGMMFALGCIQALKCNTNTCPVGVATQNRSLQKGLVVADKAARVASYQQKTVASLLELIGAVGLQSAQELRPQHVYQRTSSLEVLTLEQLYPTVPERCLLSGQGPDRLQTWWNQARLDHF